MFTASPAHVGASPPLTSNSAPSSMLMPTTCSTGVLDIGIDAMRAQQDMKTVLESLLFTPAAYTVLPATRPPHPPNQPRLLLDRAPPWPLWNALSMCCTTHGRAWLLPVLSCPPEPSRMAQSAIECSKNGGVGAGTHRHCRAPVRCKPARVEWLRVRGSVKSRVRERDTSALLYTGVSHSG
jgi:hypothetical protein